MPVAGLEPARRCRQQILSLPRLPIPTHRPANENIAQSPQYVNLKFTTKLLLSVKSGNKLCHRILSEFCNLLRCQIRTCLFCICYSTVWRTNRCTLPCSHICCGIKVIIYGFSILSICHIAYGICIML